MKKFISFCFVLLACLSSEAQIPVLQWAKDTKSLSTTNKCSMVVDTFGNVYTSGSYTGKSVDFDPGPGTTILTATSSQQNLFIAKYGPAGNFLWVKNIEAISSYVYLNDLKLDQFGNIYATGKVFGTADFDPGAGTVVLPTSSYFKSAYILKLNSNGDYRWAKSFYGSNVALESYAMAIDGLGNVYTTGFFTDTCDFDPSSSTVNLISKGQYDIFVSKLDSNGSHIWVKQMGGASQDNGMSIGVDSFGNVYTTGEFYATCDFDPSAATFNLTPGSTGREIYLSKLNANGDFVWAKKTNRSPSSEQENPLQVDALGNIYLGGRFGNTVNFNLVAGTANLVSVGSWDIFLAKYDSAANLIWVKGTGGSSAEYINNISLDPRGYIYATGYFQGICDFDPSSAISTLTSKGMNDVFILKFDTAGNYLWSKSMGGKKDDVGHTITFGVKQDVFTSGVYKDTCDMDPDASIVSNLVTNSFNGDFFVQKLSNEPLPSEIKNLSYQASEYTIYPNPNNGIFTVETSLASNNNSVEVFNIFGQLVYRQSAVAASTLVDFSNQASGVYFVKIMNDGHQVGVQKIMKQ